MRPGRYAEGDAEVMARGPSDVIDAEATPEIAAMYAEAGDDDQDDEVTQ
jgi:hypothetical protein